jgi:alpha-glucosidase
MVRELDDLGVKLVTILDPGVKLDENYAVYTSGRADDLFCKTFAGEEYHNVVWPGMCAFPDFTNPRRCADPASAAVRFSGRRDDLYGRR